MIWPARRMRLPTLLAPLGFIALATLAGAEPAIPAHLAPLLQAGEERLMNRTFVPSVEQKVGEVRLLRRGDVEVVQTLLYTKILKRVVAEIRKKELGNWPPGIEGSADAPRYEAALTQAQEQIWANLPKFERGADPRQKLLIEFVLSRDRAAVLLAEYDMQEKGGEVRVTGRRPLIVLEPSRHYVYRNMRLIIADSFKVPETQVGRLVDGLPLLAAPETP